MFTIIKDIKTYLYYKSVLKSHANDLGQRFNLRIDRIGRLYTIFSIDPKEYQQYGDELFDTELKKYLASVDKHLMKIGLTDLYGLAVQERIDELNYKIIIRFKPLDTLVMANLATLAGLAVIMGLVIATSLFFLIG
jgi:hypothetical protein